jgi:hypothetical protein
LNESSLSSCTSSRNWQNTASAITLAEIGGHGDISEFDSVVFSEINTVYNVSIEDCEKTTSE